MQEVSSEEVRCNRGWWWYGDSSMGGGFSVEFRQTGIDVLSIIGKAPELSVLFIDNSEATIIPMPELKGKSCLEAEGIIKERLDTCTAHVAIIGPAGENIKTIAFPTRFGQILLLPVRMQAR